MKELSIDNLANMVGLSEGAIYRHFASKEDILRMVLEDVERTLKGILDHGTESEASPVERLRGVLQTHLSVTERRRGVSFLVINEVLALNDPELRARAREILEEYLQRIEQLVRLGMDSGEVRAEIDPHAAAEMFFGMVQSNVTLWTLRDHSYSLKERHAALWELFYGAIAAGGETVGSQDYRQNYKEDHQRSGV